MKRIKIANILLEESHRSLAAPLLYVRATAPWHAGQDGCWVLCGPGTYDFTTFFNALSVRKYDQYTIARSYHLHLEVKGAACTVTQTHATALDYYSCPMDSRTADLDADERWRSVDIALSYDAQDVLLGFCIEAQGPVCLRNASYSADVDETLLRPVELALSSTTFKKEDFILSNIELVRSRILGSTEPIAGHFRMYVVDNGRTLDAEGLSHDGVSVFPNSNVGGSGGFAYGMVKALEAGDVTHILLMDDDVEVEPESIMRTYNLLRIVNDEYADAFVSGAMMSFDDTDLFLEDLGHMDPTGIFVPVKRRMHMSSLFSCVQNEVFEPDTVASPWFDQTYAAWWYCCIPLTQIRRNGLPLPFFVRFDDAEYGMRCAPRFMTMNGICIWHLAFDMRYNAGVERYQTHRNGLIGQAMTGVCPMTDFLVDCRFNMMIELLKFNYDDAALICEGLEDYLKGPAYVCTKGMAEQRFMDANRNKERLVPLADLADELRELGIDVSRLTPNQISESYPLGRTKHGKAYNVAHTQMLERTLNGQLGGRLTPFESGVCVIDALGWSYPMGKIYGADTVVAIDIPGKRAVIRRRDNARGKQLWQRFQDDVKRCVKERDQLRELYAAERERVTSVAFWKDYLDLD